MAILPKIRDKISISSGNKNQSLKDILAPMGVGVEVLSVEAVKAPLHNTKASIRIDNSKLQQTEVTGDKYTIRNILYNRIDIATVLPEVVSAPLTNMSELLKELNGTHRCDFTEDDIEVVGGVIKAKETSLGYYNSGNVAVNKTPTDEISFGIRPLPWGAGDLQSFHNMHYYHQVVIYQVNGTVYQPTPIASNGQFIEPWMLAASFKTNLEADFPLLKVELLERTWHIETYHAEDRLSACVARVVNLDPLNPVEISVHLHTLDQDGEYMMEDSCILLPIAKLEPAGSGVVESAVSNMVTLDGNQFDLEYTAREETEADLEEFGKALRLNGATGTSRISTTPPVESFSTYLHRPEAGLVNALMLYRREFDFEILNPFGPALMMVNLMENRIKVEHPALTNAVTLAKVDPSEQLDRVLINISRELLDYTPETSTIWLQVGENRYQATSEDFSSGQAMVHWFEYFITNNPEIATQLNIGILKEVIRDYNKLYVENLTDTPLDFAMGIESFDGVAVRDNPCFPALILQPKGTKGLSYVVADQEVSTIGNTEVTDLINNQLADTITWRGVTHDIREFKQSSYQYDPWEYSIFNSVIQVTSREGVSDREFHYFTNNSCFAESFILNEGMENEVAFIIQPKQLVNCAPEPS